MLRSPALQAAAAADDPTAARAAARALITSGHVARLRLTVGGRVLTDIGDRAALAPVSAVLTDAGGAPIGTVLIAVQSGTGFVSTIDGLTCGGASLRSGGHVLAGASPTGRGSLPTGGLVDVERHRLRRRIVCGPGLLGRYRAGDARALGGQHGERVRQHTAGHGA